MRVRQPRGNAFPVCKWRAGSDFAMPAAGLERTETSTEPAPTPHRIVHPCPFFVPFPLFLALVPPRSCPVSPLTAPSRNDSATNIASHESTAGAPRGSSPASNFVTFGSNRFVVLGWRHEQEFGNRPPRRQTHPRVPARHSRDPVCSASASSPRPLTASWIDARSGQR